MSEPRKYRKKPVVIEAVRLPDDGGGKHPGFSEQSLRQCIVNTWGPAGAHVDVFDSLRSALAAAEARIEALADSARLADEMVDDMRSALAAKEAVVGAARTVSACHPFVAISGPDEKGMQHALFDSPPLSMPLKGRRGERLAGPRRVQGRR